MEGALTDTARFELSFSPNLGLVSTVRKFVNEFYSQILFNEDATSQLAVATHELLDNAVVYSSDGLATLRIGIRSDGKRLFAHIETVNRTSAPHAETVRRTIDELTAAANPSDYLQALMRETAKRAVGSGLGLARVRAECDMIIEYKIEGDELHLRATAAFSSETKQWERSEITSFSPGKTSMLNPLSLQKTIDAQSLTTSGLTALASSSGQALVLKLTGEATNKTSEALAIVMRAVHTEALRGGATTVSVDLRQVSFMNSSSIKALVSWIGSLSEVAEAQRYRIRFIRDSVSSWQRRSLNTLQCFAPEWIDVEEQDKL